MQENENQNKSEYEYYAVQIYIIGRRNFDLGKCKILVKRYLHKYEAASRFTSWYGTNLKTVSCNSTYEKS